MQILGDNPFYRTPFSENYLSIQMHFIYLFILLSLFICRSKIIYSNKSWKISPYIYLLAYNVLVTRLFLSYNHDFIEPLIVLTRELIALSIY